MASLKLKNIIRGLIWFVLLLTCVQVDAQFFTKSSKSIPRMGRRSVAEDGRQTIEQLRHSLIDKLLDEYGPNLIENLVVRELPPGRSQEMYNENAQPIDWKQSVVADGVYSLSPMSATMLSSLSRDERSPNGGTKERNLAKDASIAIRALNANRYLQYLASGQPPMSLDRVLSLQEPTTAAAYKQTNFINGDK